MFGAGGGGQPTPVPSPNSALTPKSQQAVAVNAANQRIEQEQKREFGMQGINEAIKQARSILQTGKPTASGIGAGVDWLGSQFGQSWKSTDAADKLRAIGGALTSKVPRMEGPQSNIDVLNYEKMAGRVGDATLPVSRRLAALEEVERLYAKYEHMNRAPAAGAGGAAISAPRVVDW